MKIEKKKRKLVRNWDNNKKYTAIKIKDTINNTTWIIVLLKYNDENWRIDNN